MNKQNWTEMFNEIGLSDDKMKDWHRIFEKRYPEDHTEFLKWLGINEEEIPKIKKL